MKVWPNKFVKITITRYELLIFLLLLFFAAICSAEIAVPPLKSHVTDLTNTLSGSEIDRLERLLAQFEVEKGSQVAVLIVPTTQPEAIEQYAIRVVENWKLGRKRIDDGVLLLVAKNDRTLRIEVGYGLEGALPDAIARRIVDEVIVPDFRRGEFARGIQAGVERMLDVIEGEPLPVIAKQGIDSTEERGIAADGLVFILVASLILGRMLQSIFGRLIGATVTGGIAGVVVWLILSSLAVASLIAVAIFILGLFENTNRGIYRGGRGRWTSGGRGGLRSGGFGGGGGGFGGGGASGRW
jgi:uncharacterized protein